MSGDEIARRIEVGGIVQGVGFRPFVYQLAMRHGLMGEVANTPAGVAIHIEGKESRVEMFCRDLGRSVPPLARVTEVSTYPEKIRRLETFRIVESREESGRTTLISPDVAVCPDCLNEMRNPNDRRYRYPFINCTNCGPRYTIIEDIPYDRPKTAMKHFAMCRLCRAEYDDPESRRFHAQPNACPACGPQVLLCDPSGRPLPGLDPIEAAAKLLRDGRILAVKGLGGFHLAVDARNHTAVLLLRKRKHREEKPFAVMAADLEKILEFARLQPEEAALLGSIERPIVLLEKKEEFPLSEAVSPGNRYVGVMLPYTPLHYLLLEQSHSTLVMTSGNLSEEPICIANEEAFRRLSGLADYFLVHDRDIYLRSDDSVVRRVRGATRFIRRSRGYVPVPVFLRGEIPPTLACGAEQKNTICVTRGSRAFLSQHIGELENLETDLFFQKTVSHMRRILGVRPERTACDLHPDYPSTRFARETGLPLVQVQHHHAHIASCMAENRLAGPVIGLAFDGAGYGTDGTIWGGEVLLADETRFERAASLHAVPMPGSAAAVKAPWRMAVSYLHHVYGEDFYGRKLPLFREFDRKKLETISAMIRNRINSPATSSLGRLFDGVAALVGIRFLAGYEGEAAVELEMISNCPGETFYPYAWERGEDFRTIRLDGIIRGVVDDVEGSVPVPEIGARFHATLIRMFSELCDLIRKEKGLDRAVLSGGVFQNAILLSGLIRSLEEKNFRVYTHSLVPPNDGGISLGQALVAATVNL